MNISNKIVTILQKSVVCAGNVNYIRYSIPLKPLNDAQMSGVFLFNGGHLL